MTQLIKLSYNSPFRQIIINETIYRLDIGILYTLFIVIIVKLRLNVKVYSKYFVNKYGLL